VQVFRSAPGGGKTSILRLFSASSLATLYEARSNENYQELYHRLQSLAVIGPEGPKVLGVYLSCAQNYALLDDLGLADSKRDSIFYALLSARYVIGALRGAILLRRLEWPGDLSRVTVVADGGSESSATIPVPGKGTDLFEWARKIESSACEIIDGFESASDRVIPAELTLNALRVVQGSFIHIDDTPVAEKSLLMLDDSHKLTLRQRKALIDRLTELRPPIGIWLAERLEALAPAELFGIGATPGREINFVNLEEHWRNLSSPKRFENAMTNIADRRARAARDVQIDSFAGHLQDSLDGRTHRERVESALDRLKAELTRTAQSSNRYRDWVAALESRNLTGYEALIEWGTLRILIARDRKKGQHTLEVGLASTIDSTSPRESSAVRAAAELHVTKEGDLPLYFGMSKLAALASANIEQFLELSGALFEEIASAGVLGRSDPLTPERQEVILGRVARERWRDVPHRVANGSDLQRFLEGLARFCVTETYKGTASYPPGVTGFALTTRDRDLLLATADSKHPSRARLLRVLSAAVSQNILEPNDEVLQGEKGSRKTVFYLNRLLCLNFRLPVGYGGWRLKSISDLCDWLGPERGLSAGGS
jgi:hypothetical protein